MNGRIYDYNLGRFMSVDPFIQSPTSTQSVNPYSYIMNNPLAGTDPTGYCSTGTHIKGKDVAGCSVVFDAGSGGSGKKKSEAKVTSNGGNNYTASFQLDKKTTLEVDFKINNIGSQGAIASGSGVGGYSDDHLAKLGFAPGTRFFNDFGDPYLPPGMTYEQHHQAMENASEIAAIGLTLAIPGPEDILLGVYIASRGAELTAKAVGLARGADVVEDVIKGAKGLETRGYRPKPGERTLEGYVSDAAKQKEIGLNTTSPGFDFTGTKQFKRFGSDSHAGVAPHVHQPIRNMTPIGPRGTTGSKTQNGGVTSPSNKDVKQLYDHLTNGKY